MLFYQIGELFQDYAVDKSRKSIDSLINIKSDVATAIVDDKEIGQILLYEIYNDNDFLYCCI